MLCWCDRRTTGGGREERRSRGVRVEVVGEKSLKGIGSNRGSTQMLLGPKGNGEDSTGFYLILIYLTPLQQSCKTAVEIGVNEKTREIGKLTSRLVCPSPKTAPHQMTRSACFPFLDVHRFLGCTLPSDLLMKIQNTHHVVIAKLEGNIVLVEYFNPK